MVDSRELQNAVSSTSKLDFLYEFTLQSDLRAAESPDGGRSVEEQLRAFDTHANARQLPRIRARREEKAHALASGKLSGRSHASRRLHAMKRQRGLGGRFLGRAEEDAVQMLVGHGGDEGSLSTLRRLDSAASCASDASAATLGNGAQDGSFTRKMGAPLPGATLLAAAAASWPVAPGMAPGSPVALGVPRAELGYSVPVPAQAVSSLKRNREHLCPAWEGREGREGEGSGPGVPLASVHLAGVVRSRLRESVVSVPAHDGVAHDDAAHEVLTILSRVSSDPGPSTSYATATATAAAAAAAASAAAVVAAASAPRQAHGGPRFERTGCSWQPLGAERVVASTVGALGVLAVGALYEHQHQHQHQHQQHQQHQQQQQQQQHQQQQLSGGGGSPASQVDRERSVFPLANVTRVMGQNLPSGTKISKEAKEAMCEMAVELTAFVSMEAAMLAAHESSRSISAECLLDAFKRLDLGGFAPPLQMWLVGRAVKVEPQMMPDAAANYTASAVADLLFSEVEDDVNQNV